MTQHNRPAWAMALRDLRARQAMSQELFAETVEVDRSTVARWELGVHRPQPQQLARICAAFAVSPESLQFVESGAEDEVKRREFNKGLVGLGVLAAGEPWERLMHAMRSGRVDAAVVGHLEQVTLSLSRLEREVESPSAVMGGVLGHLDTLTGFVQGTSGTHRRALCSLAAETAGLAGWLAWDLDDQPRADAYFRSALEAAHEAGDAALGAYLVGSRAIQPFYREDPNLRLRNLGGRMFGFAPADASPHTRAWLLLLEAGAHALAGDAARFACAADGAEELLQVAEPPETRRPRVPFFDWAYFAEEKAAGLLRLGQARAARELLEQALGASVGRMRLWVLTDLAEAYAAEGEPATAARRAGEALSGAAGSHVEPVLQALRELPGGAFRAYARHPAVAEFAERVRGA